MSDLRFVNSKSIALLVLFQREVTDRSGKGYFVGINARMKRLLESYLGKAFLKTFDSKKDAMANYGASCAARMTPLKTGQHGNHGPETYLGRAFQCPDPGAGR